MAIGPGSLRSKVPTVLASVAGILLLALAMDAIFQVGQNAYLAALVATFAGVLAGLPLALYVDRLQQRQEEKVRVAEAADAASILQWLSESGFSKSLGSFEAS